jgi:hypothetical protein
MTENNRPKSATRPILQIQTPSRAMAMAATPFAPVGLYGVTVAIGGLCVVVDRVGELLEFDDGIAEADDVVTEAEVVDVGGADEVATNTGGDVAAEVEGVLDVLVGDTELELVIDVVATMVDVELVVSGSIAVVVIVVLAAADEGIEAGGSEARLVLADVEVVILLMRRSV